MNKWQRELPIPAAEKRRETATLEFSFKHLDAKHPRFKMEICPAEYFHCLLYAIQKYSSYTIERFRDQNRQTDRHTIDFRETSEQLGFTSLDENLQLEEPWQFRVCPDRKQEPQLGWRASGFLAGNVFYLVWLDSRHELYPDDHPNHKSATRFKKKK